jgi:phage terminase small subunit
MAMKDSTLEKYKLVVDEWFINGFNGTKAYQKYYPNSSDETAKTKFIELVRIGTVTEYKQEKHDAAKITLGTTHDELLNELRNWAYSDASQFMLLTPQEVKDLPPELTRLITEFEHTKVTFEGKTTEKLKLKFVSKEKAIDIITKHVAFFTDHNSQKTPVTNINLSEWVEGTVKGAKDMDDFEPKND